MSEWLVFGMFIATIIIVWFAAKFHGRNWQHETDYWQNDIVADIMTIGDDMAKLVSEHVQGCEALQLVQEWDQIREEVRDVFPDVSPPESDDVELVDDEDDEDDEEEEWR